MGLKDKIAVVTGASRGLGLAIACELSKRGARIAAIAQDAAALKAACSELNSRGCHCDAYVVDVTKKYQIKKFVENAVKKYGSIDVLINNAGWATMRKNIEDTSEEEYEKTMATNLNSVFFFLQNVLPVMKKQNSGTIVNVSSGAGKRGYGGLAAYSASKFGVLGLTQAAAWELTKTGVRCVAICPVGINTAMRRKIFGEEDADRQQSPESVAKIIADVTEEKIKVPNGGDVSIRGGKVENISNPLQP